MEFNISSKQIGVRADNKNKRVTLTLPGEKYNTPIIRHLDQANLEDLVRRLKDANQWLNTYHEKVF